MSAVDSYFQNIREQLTHIEQTQRALIEQAADWVSSALQNERFIYVFGSGHSHTMAERFFRGSS